MYIYMYIYIYTHTHTSIYIYIYILSINVSFSVNTDCHTAKLSEHIARKERCFEGYWKWESNRQVN